MFLNAATHLTEVNQRLIILGRGPASLPVACASLLSFGVSRPALIYTVKCLNRDSKQKPGKYSKHAYCKAVPAFNTALQGISFSCVGWWLHSFPPLRGPESWKRIFVWPSLPWSMEHLTGHNCVVEQTGFKGMLGNPYPHWFLYKQEVERTVLHLSICNPG